MSAEIVVVTLGDPRSQKSGGAIREHNIAVGLSKIGNVALFCFEPFSENSVAPIGQNPAEFYEVVNSRRTNQIKAFLTTVFFDVSFISSQASLRRSFDDKDLERLQNADVVVCHQWATLESIVRERIPLRGKVVWDTENFDLDVWSDKMRLWPFPKSLLARRQRLTTRRLAPSLSERADLVICCSTDDQESWAELLGRDALLVSNGADTTGWDVDVPVAFDFVIFGSLAQLSTERGVRWFIEEVWIPHFADAGSSLLVTGRQPSKRLARLLAATPGVTLDADPDDMPASAKRGATVLVPQPGGTGSKIKTMEALASGRPVIGSARAFVGVGVEWSQVTVASSSEDWTSAMRRTQSERANGGQVADRDVPNWCEVGAQFARIVEDIR